MLVLVLPCGWLLAAQWSARNPGRMVVGALRSSLRGDGFCKRSGSLPLVRRQFRQLKRLDNVGIHFNTDGLLQEMDAQNQPGDVFLSHQNPFAALQRAEADADFPAHLQIRMKIVWELGFDEAADGVDFELGIAAGLPSNMIEREVLMA